MSETPKKSPKRLVDMSLYATAHPAPTTPAPSEEQIEEWVYDSVCEATDGCDIEPDGICPHGHPSWLLRLGLI